jgi:hypothetical protein
VSRDTLGIFCIENWTGDLRSRSTVQPLLEFLEKSDVGVRFIHQRVATLGELRDYMDRWSALDSYELGFLALHGSPGKVQVGSEAMRVGELLDRSWDRDEDPWVIDLSGKTLYFGSCSTFSGQDRFEEVARQTKARLVCGYRRSVSWDEAAGFEVMLLSALAAFDSPFEALRDLRRRQNELIQSLHFDWMPKRRAGGSQIRESVSRSHKSSPKAMKKLR